MKNYRRLLMVVVLSFILFNIYTYVNITQKYKAEGCYKDAKNLSCNVYNSNNEIVEVDTYSNFKKDNLIKKSYYPYTNGVFAKEETYVNGKPVYKDYYPNGTLKSTDNSDNKYTYSVGSYNIKTQGSSKEHFPSWRYRRQEMVEQVKTLDYDILGMQEVSYSSNYDQNQQAYIKDNVNSVYSSVTSEGSTNMILYKHSKYNLLKQGSKFYDEQGDTIEEVPFNQYRGYIYCILQDKVTSKKILVMNTHLIVSNDNEKEYSAVQKEQLEELVKEAKNFEKANQINATFIMGDFNIDSLNGFNNTPLKVFTDNDFYCSDFNESTITLGQTNYKTKDTTKEIDYVCSGNSQTSLQSQKIEDVWKDLDEDTKESTKTEDNYISDHLPINAVFTLQD